MTLAGRARADAAAVTSPRSTTRSTNSTWHGAASLSASLDSSCSAQGASSVRAFRPSPRRFGSAAFFLAKVAFWPGGVMSCCSVGSALSAMVCPAFRAGASRPAAGFFSTFGRGGGCGAVAGACLRSGPFSAPGRSGTVFIASAGGAGGPSAGAWNGSAGAWAAPGFSPAGSAGGPGCGALGFRAGAATGLLSRSSAGTSSSGRSGGPAG